jgi:hypothetical protein
MNWQPPMYYPASYQESRRRFHEKVAQRGGICKSLPIGNTGFALEVAEFGPTQADSLLVHISGTHGIEGFAGSAIQHALVESENLASSGCAVSLVHVLSGWGMQQLRKVNADNVDLNRNFHFNPAAFSGAPSGYSKLHEFINPSQISFADLFYLKTFYYIARYGFAALKQSIAGGQYAYPKGLFYGGSALTAEARVFVDYFVSRAKGTKRIGVIDVHTGLGAFTQESLLVRSDLPAESLNALRQHFGNRIEFSETHSSVAYKTAGGLVECLTHLGLGAEIYPMVQEFGTYSSVAVFRAMREENYWHQHFLRAQQPYDLQHPSKRRMQEAFSPSSERWRGAVLQKGVALYREMYALISKK